MIRQFCITGLVLLVTVGLTAPAALAIYTNGTRTWNIRAEIDTQLALIAPGQGVHIDMSGAGTTNYTNAIPGVSVDIEIVSMSLTGTISVPGLGLTGTANGTLFVPTGSIQGPGTSSGQLTPTNSHFNAYTRIQVINLGGNSFTMYTGLNSDHGGLKSSPFKEETNADTGSQGFGVYQNTRFPLDFMASTSGGTPTYMSPIIGATWTITPEPVSLALLALGLPLVCRRRRP
ncbi:MAG: hypothetical protein HY718_02945 [Planctomycetes bacterium]|nr:hypothetical protein [Planctomycetota bacterium]